VWSGDREGGREGGRKVGGWKKQGRNNQHTMHVRHIGLVYLEQKEFLLVVQSSKTTYGSFLSSEILCMVSTTLLPIDQLLLLCMCPAHTQYTCMRICQSCITACVGCGSDRTLLAHNVTILGTRRLTTPSRACNCTSLQSTQLIPSSL